MKNVIAFALALAIILAGGREGNLLWQVKCHDSVWTYVAYERMNTDWENDICN